MLYGAWTGALVAAVCTWSPPQISWWWYLALAFIFLIAATVTYSISEK